MQWCLLYALREQVLYYYTYQEYIIGKRESILLPYGTVLQPFPGFMTFGVIYTCLRYHSLLFVGMLASLYGIYNTCTVLNYSWYAMYWDKL